MTFKNVPKFPAISLDIITILVATLGNDTYCQQTQKTTTKEHQQNPELAK